MSDRVETLGHLLDPDGRGLGAGVIAALKQSEAMVAIRAALTALPSGALADLAHSAAEALRHALAIRIGDVLAAGWNTGRRLLKHRNDTSADVIDVPLAEHTIRSTHQPRVAVLVNDVPVGESRSPSRWRSRSRAWCSASAAATSSGRPRRAAVGRGP